MTTWTDSIKAQGQVSWHNDKQQLDLTQVTKQLGAACLAIGTDAAANWHSDKPLWLVENQALFDRCDWLPSDHTDVSLIYYAGQLPKLLLDWLGARKRCSELWLFPDYDGVGLANYARLKQQLGDAARLWLMPDWQAKLKRYSDNRIWQDTRPQFLTAAAQLQPWLEQDGELSELLSQLQQTALALEQEAVWLPL